MRLEIKRLILRDWVKADTDDIVEGLNNLEVAKWLTVPHPYTLKHAEEFISRCVDEAANGKDRISYDFAIELKSEQKVIGGLTLGKISMMHGTAGGGIWVNSNYQGHGYGAEAFGERIRFAFEDLELRRLDNGYFEGNVSSLKMQEKFGYKVEGMRRKAFHCMADGEVKHEYITGLLVEEWKRV